MFILNKIKYLLTIISKCLAYRYNNQSLTVTCFNLDPCNFINFDRRLIRFPRFLTKSDSALLIFKLLISISFEQLLEQNK